MKLNLARNGILKTWNVKCLLCLNVLQVVVLMESSTLMFGADTAGARLYRTCSPALVQDCVVQGSSSWSSSSSLCTQAMRASMSLSHPWSDFVCLQQWGKWWTAGTGEGGHGGQMLHQNKAAELAQLCWDAVGCGFTACKYIIVRISLNKALFHVSLTYLFSWLLLFFYLYSCFLLLSVNKI